MLSPAQLAFQEYHRRRNAERLALRECRREALVADTRAAVARIAPRHPAIRRVYLFGSLLQTGRFTPRSDVDLAVDADDIRAETPFWSEMERALHRNVDLRPRQGAIADAVAAYGELCYEREPDPPRACIHKDLDVLDELYAALGAEPLGSSPSEAQLIVAAYRRLAPPAARPDAVRPEPDAARGDRQSLFRRS